jgi:uridine phosphorylase
VLSFRDLAGTRDLVEAFGARPWTGGKLLYGMTPTRDEPKVYEAGIGGVRIGIVGQCQWGGPQAAILAEELCWLGAGFLVGFGVCGALIPELPVGRQVVVTESIGRDGTARAYSRKTLRADRGMVDAAGEAAREMMMGLKAATSVTIDALYRETPARVRSWRKAGAQVVNMESSALYAAGQACGARCVWIGHVSDRLLDGPWEHWDDRPEEAARDTAQLAVGLVERVLKA